MRASERLGNITLSNPPVRRRITVGTKLQDRLCTPVPRLHVRQRKWPARIRDAFARFEIDWIRKGAPPSPVVCGTSEVTKSKPNIPRVEISTTNIGAAIKFLRCLLKLSISTFKQDNANIRIYEFARQRNPGRACADNTDLSFNDGTGRHRKCVNKHPAPAGRLPGRNAFKPILVLLD